jgi:hypothetical protein
MYGTVAKLRVQLGKQAEIAAIIQETAALAIPGMVASYVYQMDSSPDEYYLAVVFESKAAYVANANSGEQDARYRQVRALLIADPEWHDGDVMSASL